MAVQENDEILNKQYILYKDVLKGVIAATHCHSCGYNMPVCLKGYVGRHCDKYCWKALYYKTFEECILDDCKFCEEGLSISLANTRYHSLWKTSLSKTGYYWPMCNPEKLCTNECIKNKPTIAIPKYN